MKCKLITLLGILLCFSSCGILGFYDDGGLLNRGDRNEYGQYMPKKAQYALKDKRNNKVVENLDTLNLFQEIDAIYDTAYLHYLKFYAKGKCLSFSLPEKDYLGFPNKLHQDHLYPNRQYARKGYYYSKDGKQGRLEFFYEAYNHWQIMGIYEQEKFFLNSLGDTLTIVGKHYKTTYKKVEIPKEWKTFQVDW